jgi:hypothetical protein
MGEIIPIGNDAPRSFRVTFKSIVNWLYTDLHPFFILAVSKSPVSALTGTKTRNTLSASTLAFVLCLPEKSDSRLVNIFRFICTTRNYQQN